MRTAAHKATRFAFRRMPDIVKPYPNNRRRGMQEQEQYFRPPAEEESFIIRVMHGCSHNRCTFCNMYKGIPLDVFPLDEVLRGIDRDAAELGGAYAPLVTSLYLDGGDPLCLATGHLLAVIGRARARFPNLRRVACYATARSINRKNEAELAELAVAGLACVYVGLESGLDAILAATCKGATRADMLRSADLARAAGIDFDVSIMLGMGGPELSNLHADSTASLLCAIRPVCVRIRTLVPNTETPLGDDYLAGRFTLMDPYAVLREQRRMVERITAPMRLLSEHWSNFIRFDAALPGDRDALLALLDEALERPREAFRETGICAERH